MVIIYNDLKIKLKPNFLLIKFKNCIIKYYLKNKIKSLNSLY